MSNFTPSGSGGLPTTIKSGDSADLVGVTSDKRLQVEVSYKAGSYPAYAYLSIIIGNGADVIQAGTTGYSAPMPYGGTITGWTIAETSTSPTISTIAVDIWKDTILNYPPTSGDKISGTEPPALNGTKVAIDSSLTTWNTTVTANDCFGFTVASTDGVAKKIHIVIHMIRNI